MAYLAFTRQKCAAIITEVLAPAPLAMLAVAIVAWQTARTPLQALVWTIIGIVFAPLVPFLHLVRQVRRGVVTDHHVQLREQRPRILLLALASGLTGLVLLVVLGAPPGLIALLAAGATALGVALVITLRWKISVHVGAVAGIITVCAILLGPLALMLVPLVPLVAWARVEMGAHTPAQAIAGGLIGALVSGVAFVGMLALMSP
jgi:membrane-associated phospholipid phosphatase